MKSKARSFGIYMFGLMLMLQLSACDKEKYEDELSLLNKNKNKWLSSEPEKYSYITSQSCFCLELYLFYYADRSIGKDSSAYLTYDYNTEEFVPLEEWNEEELVKDSQRFNINALFDTCQKSLEKSPASATIVYDEVYGYPKEAFFDFSKNIADEEWGFNIREFTILN